MVERTYIVQGDFPRQVMPDFYWLGGCSNSGAWPGREIHEARHELTAAYLIIGSKHTLMIDTGHYGHWYVLRDQLQEVLAGRPIDFVFPTHQEIPHSGNLGRLLELYPDAVAVGDVRDYHLFHPDIELDRLVMMDDGDSVDLGDRRFVFVDAIWKDLTGTMWGYDDKNKMLFTSDGFGMTHMHQEDICDLMPHEMSDEKLSVHRTRYAAPFVGFRYQDQTRNIRRFRDLQKRFPIEAITSAHGGPLVGDIMNEIVEETLAVFATGEYGPQKIVQTGWRHAAKF